MTYEGESVYSDHACLTVADYADTLPVLRAQSGDVTVREGDTVTLSVEADNVQTYQWQYSKDKGKTWNILRNSKVWEGNQAAELSFRATLSQDQMLIRCLVTNLAGTASTKPIQLTVLFGSSD